MLFSAGWIDVAWDAGGTNSYRMGAEGKYDLMLAPSHNPEKTRKDLLSPRSLNKAKGLTAEGSDNKNKVCLNIFLCTVLFLELGYWHQRADERHGNPPPK